MLRKSAEIFEFSKKKFTKTAGFGKCQQVDLDLVYKKQHIYLVLK